MYKQICQPKNIIDPVAMDEPYRCRWTRQMVYLVDNPNFAVYYMLQGDSGMEFYSRDGTTKSPKLLISKKGRCVISFSTVQ